MEVTRQLLKTLREEIDIALQAVVDTHKLQSLKCGNASFDPTAGTFTFKLEGVTEGSIGKEAALYEANRKFRQLPPLGTKFVSGRNQYEVVGMKRSGKVLATRVDGNTYIFDANEVCRLTREAA